MSVRDSLRIPKTRLAVTLWVHPHGRVVGDVFVRPAGEDVRREESPLDVANDQRPFLVVESRDLDEIRFFNKSSIVRIEYEEAGSAAMSDSVTALGCALHMMDGSLLEGTVMKSLPPEHARLFDFLNLRDERFIKLYPRSTDDQDVVTLVNKSYIVSVSTAPIFA